MVAIASHITQWLNDYEISPPMRANECEISQIMVFTCTHNKISVNSDYDTQNAIKYWAQPNALNQMFT